MSGPFKMKGNPMQRNFGIGSPAKKHEEGHEEEEIVEAHNQKLSDYLTSDGTKTVRGGIKAARQGLAEREGPKLKLGGWIGKLFGGGGK